MSTNKQDTALQLDAFKRAGVRTPVTEKWSSVGARPQLTLLLARLKPGDELVVWKLDRMGRSLQDLLHLLDLIHQRGAGFRSLTEPIDTRTPAGKLMYSVLGAVAEFERTIIRERCVAGQVAAYSRGVRWGGRPKLTDADVSDMETLNRAGFSWRVLAEMWGVGLTSVQRARDRKGRTHVPLPPLLGRYLDNPRS